MVVSRNTMVFTSTPSTTKFPSAFKCYLPRDRKVYGVICISPDNKILLVKGRLSGMWSFPKGHMEHGETSLQCALRELQEETGLKLRGEPISFKKYSTAGYFIFTVPEEYRLFPQDCKEIEDVGWFTFTQINKLEKNIGVSLFCRHINKSILADLDPHAEPPSSPYPMSALSS